MSLRDDTPIEAKRSHFRNLVAVALADGTLDETESEFLSELGAAWGFPFHEVQEMLTHQQDLEFVVPQGFPARRGQLIELVGMMIIDGVIDQREHDLCVEFGKKMGFDGDAVTMMIDQIVDGMGAVRR